MPELKLCTSSRLHPKIKRLKRKLGADGVLGLYNLWCFCIEYRVDGKLTDMEPLDIAEAADYAGCHEGFVHTLCNLRLLDANGGVLTVHGWNKYNLGKPKRQRSSKASPSADASESLGGKYTPVAEVVSYYKTVHPTRGKNIKPGSAAWKRIRRAIKDGNSVEDLIKAIDGNKICPWHQNVPAGHGIEYIFRNQSKIEGFIERANDPDRYDPKQEQVGHHKGSEKFNDGDQAAGF